MEASLDKVTPAHGLSVAQLRDFGLHAGDGNGIAGHLEFERPLWLFSPRHIRHCRFGAFSYVNGRGSSSLYRVHTGRYFQCAESTIIGAPDHPRDWFTTHPFGFTRPEEFPSLYDDADFARLGPDDSESYRYTDGVPLTTVIGHEVWIGAGVIVRRGVRIGDGAIIGAGSVVNRDVPPYAIAAGIPATVKRMRFDDALIERLLALQWWQYDLAPHKHEVDFRDAEGTTAYLEEALAAGRLAPLALPQLRVTPGVDGFAVAAVQKEPQGSQA
ncbi:MAG: CatB-related O-acetyltransferase [Algiphilus sp.]|uniref:CatB-related O-acetyltransferase n=1 Tax=Algiphilus sp. TaxID=1872431 RepID=UPI001CA797AD|nr:CatB-related O-acetyltransferase [Algiphilus sp.]MBY8966089.1 CatB-related O-acetyltransferase [Algiphilus acroporae]